jgi:hypothetical protein
MVALSKLFINDDVEWLGNLNNAILLNRYGTLK